MLHIITREFRRLPRRPTFHKTRRWLMLGIGGLILLTALGPTAPLGLQIFRIIGYTLLIFIALAIPAEAANHILDERRGHNLDLLRLTGLGPSTIVLAKFLSLTLAQTINLLLALPLLILGLSFGGLTLPQLLYGLATIASTLFLFTAIGILPATLPGKANQSAAPTRALIISAFYTLATIPLDLQFPNLGISPLQTFARILINQYTNIPFFLSINLILTLLALFVASLTMRRVMQPETSTNHRTQHFLRHTTPLSGNPIAWNEQRRPRLSNATLRNLLFLFALALLVPLPLLFLILGGQNERQILATLAAFLTGIGILLLAFTALNIFNRCCNAFARDHESGALSLLLTTPLTSKTILHGKLQGIARSNLRPCLLASLLIILSLPLLAYLDNSFFLVDMLSLIINALSFGILACIIALSWSARLPPLPTWTITIAILAVYGACIRGLAISLITIPLTRNSPDAIITYTISSILIDTALALLTYQSTKEKLRQRLLQRYTGKNA